MFKPCSAQLYFQSTQNFVTVKTKSIFSQGHIIVVLRLWDHTVASVGLCQDHFQPSHTSILKLLRESHLCLMVLWVISMRILVYSTTKKDHAWILVPCFAQIFFQTSQSPEISKVTMPRPCLAQLYFQSGYPSDPYWDMFRHVWRVLKQI